MLELLRVLLPTLTALVRERHDLVVARMSSSGEAFSIPRIERSTRRWLRNRD
jgi:hypothetical protein